MRSCLRYLDELLASFLSLLSTSLCAPECAAVLLVPPCILLTLVLVNTKLLEEGLTTALREEQNYFFTYCMLYS